MKHPYIGKGQWPIILTNAVYLFVSLLFFTSRQNYEFLIYIFVIAVAFVLILMTNERVRYPNSVLWGLTIWGILHVCGGGIRVNNDVLYGLILLPLSEKYAILRYDQVAHAFGFGVATLVMHHLIRPLIRADVTRWTAFYIVVVMAGLGVGALNEIVEFIAVVVLPETGVGGYINTAMDLVSDLVGALGAAVWLRLTVRPAFEKYKTL